MDNQRSKEEIQKDINKKLEKARKKTIIREHYIEQEVELSKEIKKLLEEVKKINEELEKKNKKTS